MMNHSPSSPLLIERITCLSKLTMTKVLVICLLCYFAYTLVSVGSCNAKWPTFGDIGLGLNHQNVSPATTGQPELQPSHNAVFLGNSTLFAYKLSSSVFQILFKLAVEERPDAFACPKPNGTFADDIDCTIYWECLDNNATQKSCKESFAFDKFNSECIPKESVPLCHLLQVYPDFKCAHSGKLYPHPEDCAKFVLCYKKKAVVSKCANNLKFDVHLKMCVDGNRAVCMNTNKT